MLRKKGRSEYRQFIAEGVRLLEEALRHERMPERVFYSETLIGERGLKLVNDFQGRGVAVEMITARDLDQLSDTEHSQGLIGLFNITEANPGDLNDSNYRNFLLIDNISDPGNAGTLIRSAAAFGIDMILLTGSTVDPYNPKVVRSSSGAIFAVPVYGMTSSFFDKWHRDRKLPLLVGDLHGDDLGVISGDLRLEDGFILAIGSEAEGISEVYIAGADARIRIGHSDRVESLNAAVAGSILMKELYDLFSGKD